MLHLFDFSTTSRLNAEYRLNETRHRQPRKGVESIIRGPLYGLNISWTSVHKRLKIGPEFLLTLSILFRPQSIAYALKQH